MSEKILAADGAYSDNGAAARVSAEVVGATPLADGSDATYLALDAGAAGCTFGLSPLVGYEDGDPIALYLRMGVEVADPADFSADVFVYLVTDAAGTDEIAAFSGGALSFAVGTGVANGVVDLMVPLTLSGWPTTLAEVVAALEVGAYLEFQGTSWTGGSFPPRFYFYEAAIYVGTAVGPPILVTRQYPRDDALGSMGSAPRLYPPPRGNRVVGGHQ